MLPTCISDTFYVYAIAKIFLLGNDISHNISKNNHISKINRNPPSGQNSTLVFYHLFRTD